MPVLAEPLLHALQHQPDVLAAWLFGSRARGAARPGSDWDLLVLLERTAPLERALELQAALSGLVEASVDVIDLRRTSVELAARALCEGVLVFERDADARVEAEADTLARAHDLAPLLRRQRRSILQETDHDRAVDRYREALGALGRLRGETPGAG